MKTISFEKKDKMKLVTFLTALLLVAVAFLCFSLTASPEKVDAAGATPTSINGIIDLDEVFGNGQAYNKYYRDGSAIAYDAYGNYHYTSGATGVVCNYAFANGVKFSYQYESGGKNPYMFIYLRFQVADDVGIWGLNPWDSCSGYCLAANGSNIFLNRVTPACAWDSVKLPLKGTSTYVISNNIFDGNTHNVKLYVESETASSASIVFSLDGVDYTFSETNTPFAAAKSNFVIVSYDAVAEGATPVCYRVSGYGEDILSPSDMIADSTNLKRGTGDARDGIVSATPITDGSGAVIGKQISYNNSVVRKNEFNCLFNVNFVDKYNHDLSERYDIAFGINASGTGAMWDNSGYFVYLGATKGGSVTYFDIYRVTPSDLTAIKAGTKTLEECKLDGTVIYQNLLDGAWHPIQFYVERGGNKAKMYVEVEGIIYSNTFADDSVNGSYMTVITQNSVNDIKIADKDRTYEDFYSFGTSIRMATLYSGLKFGSKISKSYYDELVASKTAGDIKSFTMGTLVVPTAILAGANLTDTTPLVLNIERTVWYAEGTDYKSFIGTVSQVTPEYFSTSFTSRAYIRIVNSDDSVTYVYGEHVETSVAEVAAKLLQQAKDLYDGGSTSNPYIHDGVYYSTARYNARRLEILVALAGI